jgi:hypothetical protein
MYSDSCVHASVMSGSGLPDERSGLLRPIARKAMVHRIVRYFAEVAGPA